MLNFYIEDKKIETIANANILSNRITMILDDSLDTDSIEEQLSNKLILFIQNTVINYSDEISSRILVVDKNNKVISDSNDILNNKKVYHSEINNALNSKTSVNTYNLKDIGRVMYVAVPVRKDENIAGACLIATSLNDIYSSVLILQRNLILISIISIMFIGAISFILADFFTKPIKEFINATVKMSQGKFNQKVNINTKDEFQTLANSFNLMSTKLDQVDIERKDFVANVSHELRTPISSMKLLSESLIYQKETDINIYLEFLKDINSEADRLNNIITDLLSLVNLDKEKLSLNLKATYLNFLIEKIIYRLKPLANRNNIEINFIEYDKYQTKVDTEKIQQSMINIIHNAINYTPKNGKIDIFIYAEGRYIVVKVSDNGIGIPKESLQNIFDRFYRVDKARARGTGGTGLGLSIANQIVQLHQGVIEVESEVGVGTSFYIKIPKDTNMV